MKQKQRLSMVNCIATSLLAYFFTIPVHELFHLLTYLAYGDKVVCYSAGAVESAKLFDYASLPPFHRIMVAGGSASILNAVIGLILLLVLLNAQLKPLTRVFLIQLMGAHLTEGFGYFMIGGFFGAGDWGNVYSYLTDMPKLITVLRIVLSVLGCAGVVGIFFLLSYMSYYFIEDTSSLSERTLVGFRLYIPLLILGFAVGMIVTALSPANASGELSLVLGFLYNMMWITFFWGFMFTGVMKVLPPKESRFLYALPEGPNWVLLAVSVALILIDIFFFGPGIWFN